MHCTAAVGPLSRRKGWERTAAFKEALTQMLALRASSRASAAFLSSQALMSIAGNMISLALYRPTEGEDSQWNRALFWTGGLAAHYDTGAIRLHMHSSPQERL